MKQIPKDLELFTTWHVCYLFWRLRSASIQQN